MSRSGTPSGSRRPGFASTSTGQQSRTVSLAEWEANAPLGETELASIAIVREACATRPLPKKFRERIGSASAGPSSQPGTPLAGSARKFQSSLLQPTLSPSRPSSAAGLHPPLSASASLPQLISTPQQFHAYFSSLTSSLSHSQDSLYRSHLAEIAAYADACARLTAELGSAEELVRSMREALGWVEERGENLRIASEGLLEEQAHLTQQSAALQLRLSYFTYLEQAQRMLHNPGEDLVLSEGFLGMVDTLDNCLTYLGEHRDFKDAEIYLIRYQQCMTRSMTLIKMYFVTALRNLGTDVQRRIGERGSLSETATLALIYTKFTSFAFPLRPLLAELEKRATANPDELGSLLDECHTAWMSTRKMLMGPRVEREVKRMEPNASGLATVDLTRSGCTYLKQTCTDEFNLFKQFFQTGEDKLYSFLEGLCDYLYDYLRPRILHEASLEMLCEICTVLQALMVRDVEVDDAEEVLASPPASPFAPELSPEHNAMRRTSSFEMADKIQPHRPTERLQVPRLLRPILQDAQTRLVFRSQALIRSDVETYMPVDEDLDYPGKIERASSVLTSQRRERMVSLDEDDDEDPDYFALPSKETQETWYPTLRSTLWILSCLHTYVENKVFQDLAQEAIFVCRKSLSTASDKLATKAHTSSTHANLFLVRHLLILKEMTASVDLASRDSNDQQDIGMIAALSTLLANALYMVGAGGLLGLSARKMNNVADAKADVDRELKRVCEDLIATCANESTAPAKAFLDRCTLFISSQTANSTNSLSSQPWAKAEKVFEIHQASKSACEEKVPKWISLLKLYLQDEATVKVLVTPLQNAILDNYKAFFDLVRSEYDYATSSTLTTPPAMHGILKRLEADAFRVIA